MSRIAVMQDGRPGDDPGRSLAFWDPTPHAPRMNFEPYRGEEDDEPEREWEGWSGWEKEWRKARDGFFGDHAGHIGQVIAALIPYVVWPGRLTAFVTGCLIGAIREIDQLRKTRDWNPLDRSLDVLAHGVGAVLLVWLVDVVPAWLA